jgi:hypothetical protein
MRITRNNLYMLVEREISMSINEKDSAADKAKAVASKAGDAILATTPGGLAPLQAPRAAAAVGKVMQHASGAVMIKKLIEFVKSNPDSKAVDKMMSDLGVTSPMFRSWKMIHPRVRRSVIDLAKAASGFGKSKLDSMNKQVIDLAVKTLEDATDKLKIDEMVDMIKDKDMKITRRQLRNLIAETLTNEGLGVVRSGEYKGYKYNVSRTSGGGKIKITPSEGKSLSHDVVVKGEFNMQAKMDEMEKKAKIAINDHKAGKTLPGWS